MADNSLRHSKYQFLEVECTHCPKCNNHCYLLGYPNNHKPYFYICFPCQWIGKIGVGPVKQPHTTVRPASPRQPE